MMKIYMGVDPATFKVSIHSFLTILLRYNLMESTKMIDSVEWEWLEKRVKLRIIGRHSLKENVSLFIKFLLNFYLENQKYLKHKYVLTKDVILDELFIFEITKAE